MKKACLLFILSGVLVVALFSCSAPYWETVSKVQATCQVPPIEKNIVGTWHFESTFEMNLGVRSGTITFTVQQSVIDPDSLFEDHLDGLGTVTVKTYKPKVASRFANYSGELFEVYLAINRSAQAEIIPFVLVTNECNKIVLGLIGSQDYGTRFTLTR